MQETYFGKSGQTSDPQNSVRAQWIPPLRWANPQLNVGKRGLLEKGSFQKSPFSRDSREFRDSRVSRDLPDCGKERRIRPFSRDSREFRDSRDSSSEKTPFVMTPFSGPEQRPFYEKLLTFARVPAKVPHIHQSSGEGSTSMWVAFRILDSGSRALVIGFCRDQF